jgi:hypothetical protein
VARTYTSERRTQQAAQTREDVVQAAIELFGTAGWRGTTVGAIAERAGVAVETVYKAVGSKKDLLRASMDAAIVGDTAPVPLADRPEMAAVRAGTKAQRIAAAANVTASVHVRSAGVWLAVVEAAASDHEIDGWRRDLEDGRRTEVRRAAAHVLGRSPNDQLVTMIWLLFGPEAYLKLVRDNGLSLADYTRFLIRSLERLA